MRIKKISIFIISGLCLTGSAYADFGDAVVGGLVGGAVGSVITNEVYHSNSRRSHNIHYSHKHKHRSNKKKYHTPVPKMTNEKRIQKALASLGFYHGEIDGEINSYETRSAIKEMNRAYEISGSASLKPEERDTLIYLGTLFGFDRYLIAGGTDQKTKDKKIQVALKVLGYYHGKVDGAIGRGTRAAIAQYQSDHDMSSTGSLDFESIYQLTSYAKEKNDNNIDESIKTLKSWGQRDIQSQQPSVLHIQAPHQESKEIPASTTETLKGKWE